jgi:hypothetical protein
MIIWEIKFLNYYNLGNRVFGRMGLEKWGRPHVGFGHLGKLTILFFWGVLVGFPKL